MYAEKIYQNLLKKFIMYFTLFLLLFVNKGKSQEVDFLKYKNQIKSIKENVTFLEIQKINENFYMLVGGGGNVGVFIGDNDVILIDNKYEIIEDVLLETIKKITSKPIKYIINTHFHHDHSDGNRAFGKQGIPIISHQNAKKRMKKDIELYGGIFDGIDGFIQPKYDTNSLPVFTYNSKMIITIDEEDIELYNFGNAHTDGDSVIYFTKSNIMHTGDAFVRYGYPYVDLNNGGSIKGLINLLGKVEILANDNTIIMPGHGKISNKKDVIQLKKSLSLLYDKTVIGLKNGMNYVEISQSIDETLNNDKIVKLNYIKSIELELSKN